MHDNRQRVETNTNIIFNLIKNNNKITFKGLKKLLEQTSNKNNITDPMLLGAIKNLYKSGHIKKTVIRPHAYTVIKNEPYKHPHPIKKLKKVKITKSEKPKTGILPDKKKKKSKDEYYKEKVVLKANLILNMIRKHPFKTQKRLLKLLQLNNKEFRTLKRQMFSNYIKTLHQQGYIGRKGLRFSKYNLVKDTPFTYAPVSIYNPKKQKEI